MNAILQHRTHNKQNNLKITYDPLYTKLLTELSLITAMDTKSRKFIPPPKLKSWLRPWSTCMYMI